MKKYGILHKPDLAQKAHDGEKDVTRRLIKPQPTHRPDKDGSRISLKYDDKTDAWWGWVDAPTGEGLLTERWKPRYQVGTVLAVRETHWRWGHHERNEKGNWRFVPQHAKMHGDEVLFSKPPYLCPADRSKTGYHKRPAIHMLWDDARTYVEIVSVRPERLHDITGAEARREGIDLSHQHDSLVPSNQVYVFAKLWDSINAARYPWSSDPWVWRYEYKRVGKPS